jgi:hypothetical protein
MFIKNGDLNPITIIEPKDDIDDADTKVALKKVIKSVKDKQKDIKEVK